MALTPEQAHFWRGYHTIGGGGGGEGGREGLEVVVCCVV